VLRKIFGPKRNEVTGELRRLSNDDFYELYSSPNTIRLTKWRKMRLVGHVGRMAESRGAYGVLVGKRERLRPLSRPRLGWEGNIKKDLQGLGGGGMDWIYLAQNRDRWRILVNVVMNLRVP